MLVFLFKQALKCTFYFYTYSLDLERVLHKLVFCTWSNLVLHIQ